METDDNINKIVQSALEKGASSVKIIKAEDIIVENWVRQKCQYGCGGYARYFSCPPYSPTPEETKRRLQEYSFAMLVEFSRLKAKERQPDVHEIMYELEREAFLSGYYKAFAYTAGPCRLCGICTASEIENPNEYSKKKCINPSKARPSMEACGINVFQTARKANYKIDVVRNIDDCFNRFGLLLIE